MVLGRPVDDKGRRITKLGINIQRGKDNFYGRHVVVYLEQQFRRVEIEMFVKSSTGFQLNQYNHRLCWKANAQCWTRIPIYKVASTRLNRYGNLFLSSDGSFSKISLKGLLILIVKLRHFPRLISKFQLIFFLVKVFLKTCYLLGVSLKVSSFYAFLYRKSLLYSLNTGFFLQFCKLCSLSLFFKNRN